MAPGSAVRLASVARHVTDCATSRRVFFFFNELNMIMKNHVDPDQLASNEAS